jgi:hypothetical protein
MLIKTEKKTFETDETRNISKCDYKLTTTATTTAWADSACGDKSLYSLVTMFLLIGNSDNRPSTLKLTKGMMVISVRLSIHVHSSALKMMQQVPPKRPVVV